MTDRLAAIAADLDVAVREVPVDQLPDLLGLLVAAAARVQLRLAQATTPQPPVASELVTAAQGAAALGIPESALRFWGRTGRVPVEQLGRFVRFRLGDVRRALASHAETGSAGIQKTTKKNGHILAPLTGHLPVGSSPIRADGVPTE